MKLTIEERVARIEKRLRILGDLIRKRSAPSISVEAGVEFQGKLKRIVDVVCEGRFSLDEIRCRQIYTDLLDTRTICHYMSRIITRATYVRLGHFFNRDHSSIIVSCDRAKRLIETEREFKDRVDVLMEVLKS